MAPGGAPVHSRGRLRPSNSQIHAPAPYGHTPLRLCVAYATTRGRVAYTPVAYGTTRGRVAYTPVGYTGLVMLRGSAVALLVLAATFSACRGGGGDDDATPTSSAETPDATAAASPAPRTPSSEIRSLDLEGADAVQALLDATGGTYVQDSVLYADLTDDGAEEAVVPVSSGGTLGDVAFIVLVLGDDDIEALLTVTADGGRGVSVSIEDGKVIAIEPAPGADDPECCPSQLFRRVYAWDGSALKLESGGVFDNPDIGDKTPDTAQ